MTVMKTRNALHHFRLAYWVMFILPFVRVPCSVAQNADDSWQYNRNYFDKGKDPITSSLVASVEYWHLNDRVLKAFGSGQWNVVVDDLNFILQKIPNHPLALEMLGAVAQATANPQLPLRYYQKAITLFPKEGFTCAQFGDYLERIGQIELAVKMLEQSMAINSKIGLSYAAMARIYRKQGKNDLADQAIRRAKELGYDEPLNQGDTGAVKK